MPEPRNDLGYGDVDARPDIEGVPATEGGESAGEERHEAAATNDGEGVTGGQTDPAYRGGDNPNVTRRNDGGNAA